MHSSLWNPAHYWLECALPNAYPETTVARIKRYTTSMRLFIFHTTQSPVVLWKIHNSRQISGFRTWNRFRLYTPCILGLYFGQRLPGRDKHSAAYYPPARSFSPTLDCQSVATHFLILLFSTTGSVLSLEFVTISLRARRYEVQDYMRKSV